MSQQDLAIKAAAWDWAFIPGTRQEEYSDRDLEAIAQTASEYRGNTTITKTDVIAVLFNREIV